jgi:hypothetical protein
VGVVGVSERERVCEAGWVHLEMEREKKRGEIENQFMWETSREIQQSPKETSDSVTEVR